MYNETLVCTEQVDLVNLCGSVHKIQAELSEHMSFWGFLNIWRSGEYSKDAGLSSFPVRPVRRGFGQGLGQ